MSVLQRCRSVSEAAQLLARFLQGKVEDSELSKLGQFGDVSLEVLLPALRSGKFLVVEAHSALGPLRRAAVRGFVTQGGLKVVRRLVNKGPGLKMKLYVPGSVRRPGQVMVQQRDGTMMQAPHVASLVPRRVINRSAQEAGLSLGFRTDLLQQTQVILYDPLWGRDDCLWPALQRAFG